MNVSTLNRSAREISNLEIYPRTLVFVRSRDSALSRYELMNQIHQVLEAVYETEIVDSTGRCVAGCGVVQICQLFGLGICLPRYSSCGLGDRFHASDVRQATGPAAIRICYPVYSRQKESFLIYGLNPNFFLCALHESGTGFDVRFLNVRPSGSLPFIIAEMMSGASSARRIMRVT